MAYSATYSTSDFKNIIVDIFGTAGAEVVPWVAVIVLIAVVSFVLLRGKMALKQVQ